jgi:hypothetical protein
MYEVVYVTKGIPYMDSTYARKCHLSNPLDARGSFSDRCPSILYVLEVYVPVCVCDTTKVLQHDRL